MTKETKNKILYDYVATIVFLLLAMVLVHIFFSPSKMATCIMGLVIGFCAMMAIAAGYVDAIAEHLDEMDVDMPPSKARFAVVMFSISLVNVFIALVATKWLFPLDTGNGWITLVASVISIVLSVAEYKLWGEKRMLKLLLK